MLPDIETLKAIYGLAHWEIIIREMDRSTDGDRVGDCRPVPDFCEATITLYHDDIVDRQKRHPNETAERVLEHELCEAVVSDCFCVVPDVMHNDDAFERGCDRMSERLRQCCERAYQLGRAAR